MPSDGRRTGRVPGRGRQRAVALGAILACAACSGGSKSDGPVQVPLRRFEPAGRCVAYVGPQVDFSIDRDWGNLEPDALVRAGDTVKVDGVARWLQVTAECSMTEQPMTFEWRLTFQPTNALPHDATASLAGAGTLHPSFVAARGSYRLTLTAKRSGTSPVLRELRIEAAENNGWVSLGPDGRVPLSTGRVNGLARDPQHPTVLYAAVSRGGVWRSDDDAAAWYPVTDHRGLPGGMATSQVLVLASGRILAGTGDSETNANPIIHSNDFSGDGVYWSDDAGATWKAREGHCRSTDRPTGTVTRLLHDPSDAQTVFAASLQSGVFRSGNGGTCWQKLRDGPAQDIAIVDDAAGGRELWAATLGGNDPGQNLYRTTDLENGSSWEPADVSSVPHPAFFKVARTRLAASGGRLYAAEALTTPDPSGAPSATVTGGIAIWAHDVHGGWQLRAAPQDPTGNNRCDGQCEYNLALAANPQKPDQVAFGDVSAFLSNDGGQSWRELNAGSSIYADQHVLLFDPGAPRVLFTGNDGGVLRVVLPDDGGIGPEGSNESSPQWEYRNTRLATGQFYDLALAPFDDRLSAGALQDAGIRVRASGRSWRISYGGDGDHVAFDASQPEVLYFAAHGGNIDHGLHLKDASGEGTVTSIGSTAPSWTIFEDPFRSRTIYRLRPALGSPLEQSNSLSRPVTSQWGCIAFSDNPFAALTTGAASDPGALLVGDSFGRVQRVTAPDDVGTSAQCGPVAPGVESRALWDGPPGSRGSHSQLDDGRVTAFASPEPRMAAPPGAPELVYVALARRDEWAVVELRLVDAQIGGRTVRKWSATPIAGADGQPGALDTSAKCQFCSDQSWIFPDSLGLDPSDPNRLYAGTKVGLFVGTRGADGKWTWAAEPTVPEAAVTEIRVREGNAGTGSIIRLSTFGRAVYERVRFDPPVGARPPAEVLTRVESLVPSASAYRVRFTVPAKADAPDARFYALALRDRAEVPGIVSDVAVLARGKKEVVVTLYDVGETADVSDTDAVELVSTDASGRASSRTTFPLRLAWHRADQTPISVAAEIVDVQGIPNDATASVEIGSERRTSTRATPFSVGAGAKDRLTLTAPETISTDDGEAELLGWSDGRRFIRGRVATITPQSGPRWVARYHLRRRAPKGRESKPAAKAGGR